MREAGYLTPANREAPPRVFVYGTLRGSHEKPMAFERWELPVSLIHREAGASAEPRQINAWVCVHEGGSAAWDGEGLSCRRLTSALRNFLTR